MKVKNPKFVIKTARDGQSYFILTAKNGQVIAKSAMYKALRSCKSGIESVKLNAPSEFLSKSDEAALRHDNKSWSYKFWVYPTADQLESDQKEVLFRKKAASQAGAQSAGQVFTLNAWNFVYVEYDQVAGTISASLNNTTPETYHTGVTIFGGTADFVLG